jgi:hypothetical protein
MSGLRSSQKVKFGEVIVSRQLMPRDFEWRVNPKPSLSTSDNPQEIFHKETEHFFRFEERNGSAIYITYTPDEHTAKPVSITVDSWRSLLGHFDRWVKLIKEEVEAIDPWADPEDSDTFNEENTLFTPLELKSVDRAIDRSMEKLLEIANENGVGKTLEDIKEDIAYLKERARKSSRAEWLTYLNK